MTRGKSQSSLVSFLSRLVSLDPSEILRIGFGGIIYLCIVTTYTLLQEIKYGVFCVTIGPTFLPLAKLIAFINLLPLIFLDAYLVDKFKRYNTAILYSFVFGILTLIFSFLFIHPEIGLYNTTQDPTRLLGWIFLCYVETFPAFLIGVFWGLMNSMHKPENAQRTYGYIISFSKLGAFLVVICTYMFLLNYKPFNLSIDDPTKIHIIALAASVFLLFISAFLFIFAKKAKAAELTSYTGATDASQTKNEKTGILAGFKTLAKNRYVLSIFLLLFLGEILTEMISYRRILFAFESKAHTEGGGLAQLTASLYKPFIFLHGMGVIVPLIFTNTVMRFLGIRVCVFIMPVITALLLLFYMITGIGSFINWLYVFVKLSYYTIAMPVRESLYIITEKDIQSKSKFIIDSVGLKLGRNTGQIFNYLINSIGRSYGMTISIVAFNAMFLIVPILWMFVAYYVGSVYHKTVEKGEVIK